MAEKETGHPTEFKDIQLSPIKIPAEQKVRDFLEQFRLADWHSRGLCRINDPYDTEIPEWHKKLDERYLNEWKILVNVLDTLGQTQARVQVHSMNWDKATQTKKPAA